MARRWPTQAQLTRSESSKHYDVLGRECLGASRRCLGEEGELACLCLVSALVIQPVLLCSSVLRRFVHATGCGKHLFVIIIIIIIIILRLLLLLFVCYYSFIINRLLVLSECYH